MTKAKALGAKAERQYDRPENDIPFHHLIHLLNSDPLVPFASDLLFQFRLDNPRVKRCIPYRVIVLRHYRKLFRVQLTRIVRLHRHVKNITFDLIGRPGLAENEDQSIVCRSFRYRAHRFCGVHLILRL